MWKISTERQRCRRKPSKKSDEVEKSRLDIELNSFCLPDHCIEGLWSCGNLEVSLSLTQARVEMWRYASSGATAYQR